MAETFSTPPPTWLAWVLQGAEDKTYIDRGTAGSDGRWEGARNMRPAKIPMRLAAQPRHNCAWGSSPTRTSGLPQMYVKRMI